MDRLNILWQLILADFRERTRRYSFLITLMAALFLGYLVLTGKYSYHYGAFEPVYNSAWVGTTVAMAGAAMFTFVGFYVVRTTVSRDRATRVGEILLTTRLSRLSYMLAKFASNLLVLWSMVGALAVTAFLGMVVNLSFTQVDLIAFAGPFVMFPVIGAIPVAAAAVLFDTVRWLRGVTGNIIYFMMAQYFLIAGLVNMQYFDLSGLGLLETSVTGLLNQLYPGEPVPMSVGFVFGRTFDAATTVRTFLWTGIDWTAPLLASRLVWPALALVMIGLAVVLFDRFEQVGNAFKAKKRGANAPELSVQAATVPAAVPIRSYGSVRSASPRGGVISMLLAELRLALKDINVIWLVVGLALLVAEALAPFEIVRKFLVPGVMIWPLTIWSSIGARQSIFDMKPLLFSSSGVHSRQFVAMLLTGVAIAVGMCLPMVIRAAAAGEFAYLALLASSTLLIPMVAFTLGVVSGSRKFFEVVYPLIWYGGSIDTAKQIDVLGTSPDSIGTVRVVVFVVIAVVSGIVAYTARRRQAVR